MPAFFLLLVLMTAPYSVQAELEIIETPRSGLEFQVGSDFQLHSFMGSMISWKHLSSEHRGWRIGLSPFVSQSSYFDGNSNDWHREAEANKYTLNVVAHRLYLGSLNQRTRSYWGFGPTFGIGYNDNKESIHDSEGNLVNDSSRIERTWNVGLSAVIGVEYFFLENMSLHGEYGADIKYTESELSGMERNSNYFSVRSRAVRLGLSVLY